MAIRTKGNPLGIVIALLAVGLFLFITNVGDVTRLQSAPTDFNSLIKSEFREGDIVEGNTFYTLNCIAEEYTERNGVRYGTGSDSLYYVIPAGEAEFVVLQVNKDLFSQMETLLDQTIEYSQSGTATTPVHFKGKIEKCNSQVETWFYEYMEYFMGASTTSEIEPYIINYTINCKDWDTVYFMFYLGLGLIILSAVIIVVALLIKKSRNAFTPASTYTPENSFARGNEDAQGFDWNNTIPAPSQTVNINYSVAPPPSPNSDIMDSVAVPQNTAPSVAPVQPTYGGYSAPSQPMQPVQQATVSSQPAPSPYYSAPTHPAVPHISSPNDAFADLQKDAMQSFAELSKESKDSFNEVNPKQ